MDIQMSLYKIADTLKTKVIYEAGKATGFAPMLCDLELPGLFIDMELTIVKLFANDAVGVLAHVVGDLYLIVSHLAKSGAVNVFLIDGNKLEMDGVKSPPHIMIGRSMSIKEVVSTLRVAIVASFLWKDRQWKVLKLPT